jgi:hypothetical protein
VAGLVVLVIAGVVVAMAGDWRVGTVVCGAAALLGAATRLTVPSPRVGALAVRSRPLDTLLLASLGAGIVALALSLP